MKITDLLHMPALPYGQRDENVFFEKKEFKARIIALEAGERFPECHMSSYVIFVVLKGQASVKIDSGQHLLREGHCLLSEPAFISLSTEKGVRILGIQIQRQDERDR